MKEIVMEGDLNLLKIIWESGYVVKGVLALLVVASVISWALAFYKKKALSVLEKNNRAFWEVYLHSQNLEDVFQNSRELSFSPYKIVFDRGYSELLKLRDLMKGNEERIRAREHFKGFGFSLIERGMQQGVNHANGEMQKSLSLLASIGSLSPFVGLFGTVWGIIDSFTALSSGGASLDAVAPGIAEALVATAVGLAAAIPAVWFFNHFNARIEQINLKLHSFEQELLNTVEMTIA